MSRSRSSTTTELTEEKVEIPSIVKSTPVTSTLSDVGDLSSSFQSQRRKWFSPRAKKKTVDVEPEPEGSLTYFQENVNYSLSTKRKKRKGYKEGEIIVTSTRLVLPRVTRVGPLMLDSIVTLQRSPPDSTLKSTKEEVPENDDTLLICTEDLTQVYLRFDTAARCMEWMITIENLLSGIGKSLLDGNMKVRWGFSCVKGINILK